MLACMVEKIYLDFRTGQIVEVVTKPAFRYILAAAGITRPPEGRLANQFR